MKTANGSWGAMGEQDPTRTIAIQYSGHRAAAPVAAGRAIKYTTDLTGLEEPGSRTTATVLRVKPLGSVGRSPLTLAYVVPEPGPAVLAVYDQAGRRVRTLVQGIAAAGRATAVWDGRDSDGRTAGAGVYLITMTTSAGSAATRAVVLR
jgi:hypothetical protein